MATTTVNTEGIDRLIGKLRNLQEIDFAPLMEDWRKILEEDNREGALAGLDGFGLPLTPVTYRPDPRAGSRKPIDYSIQPNDNLTSGHYRTLDGPPLAPQGLESRIVTRFRTKWDNPTPNTWIVSGSWEDVLTIAGMPLLPYHFDGPEHNPNLPVRDLAHVRPGALAKARQALVDFLQRLLRSQSQR